MTNKNFKNKNLNNIDISEDKYKILVQHLSEGIIVTQDGYIKYANPRIFEFSGYSGKEIYKLPFLDLVYPNDKHFVKENYNKRIKGEIDYVPYTFRIITKKPVRSS